MALWSTLVLALGVASGSLAPQQDASVLARARQAYNEQRFDEAVTLATAAASDATLAAPAALVRSRALLERYRRHSDVADVALARQALLLATPARLSPRERDEWRLATGELLFIDEQYGAAAEVFGLALSQTGTNTDRLPLLEWWASSLDRHAQIGSDDERRRRYGRLLDGLDREPVSAVSQYWRAAAYRGVDDLDRAWSVAVATWIQAPHLTTGAAVVTLRDDVDRLMREAIIPERSRRAPAPSDPDAVRVALSAEWDSIKKRWSSVVDAG